jgi:hypothetical protein
MFLVVGSQVQFLFGYECGAFCAQMESFQADIQTSGICLSKLFFMFLFCTLLFEAAAVLLSNMQNPLLQCLTLCLYLQENRPHIARHRIV